MPSSRASAVPEPSWLVVGADGMLGTELMGVLRNRQATGIDQPALDIRDANDVRQAVIGFDVVVNCAAWTAVDDAEAHEGAAFEVNATGAGNLARALADTGGQLLQISTDYVFDGTRATPYPTDAAPAPKSAYGRTKLAGELEVRAALPDRSWILRSAWMYGQYGPNFVATMSRLERERDQIEVVNDQFGQPTWTGDLAERIVDVVDQQLPAGIYHATASGRASWFDLARRVFELVGADPSRVQPTTTSKFPRPAPRPANSVLAHDCWPEVGLEPMRDWQSSLDDAWASGLAANLGR